MSVNFEYIRDNYNTITENINKYAYEGNVSIMAVTKTVPIEKIDFACKCGIRLVGENRVQEFMQKLPFYDAVKENVEIHFIGGLQSNKVKYIIDKVSIIQSADSMKLLTEIDKRAKQHELIMDVLIEVNIGSEYTKSGVEPEAVFDLTVLTRELSNIRLRGLMTIPPVDASEQVYANMQRLFNDVKAEFNEPDNFDILSMGMSDDYITAIKHGANLIRIGSALFGSR